MLGPPLETFKTNWSTLTIVVILGFLVELPFYLAESESPTVQSINAILLGLFAIWIGWLWSVSISLHEDGVSYRSLFGSKELRREELERFYYIVSEPTYTLGPFFISLFAIPLGMYHSYRLVDSDGRKIYFGIRFRQLQKIGDSLVQHTSEPLFRKLSSRLNAGTELDFGVVPLNRDEGLKVKSARWSRFIPPSWARFRRIPWEELGSYAIDKGQFYFWRVGDDNTWGLPIGEIPNAFVLLDAVGAGPDSSSPASDASRAWPRGRMT